MIRYVGIIDSIDWTSNKAKVRLPNRDGFLTDVDYRTVDSLILRQLRTPTDKLEEGDIPTHLQGLRVGDIVMCLDSEHVNSSLIIIGFFKGRSE